MLHWILVLSLALACCGGKGATAGGEKKVDLDADPLALLPGSAVVVANLDTRAIFSGGSAGAQVAAFASGLAPIGDEVGFQARRDVDRVTLGVYATGGADFAAVLSGRFDETKIAAATTASGGAPIVRGIYAGRTTYTVGAVQYAVLTSKTLVAGSADGLRRLLERVQAATLDRSMAPWMVETLETKGADVALAADLETQPLPAAAMGTASLSWLKGMRVARVIGNFAPPGMNVAATMTYGDPQLAQAAADGVRFVDGWLNRLGPLFGGVRLQNLEVTTDASDLRCKFAVDDQTLRTVLALTSHLLPASP
jgi:hypothetical protein